MNDHSYPWRVMHQRATRCWSAIFALCAGMLFSAGAQDKPIRLRNETIATPAPPLAAAGQGTNDRAVSGLFLIQFTDRLQPAWRGELKAKGVELLQYVPDDAFVARLDNVRARDLRRLPYVRWVGDYRPDHKIQSSLRVPPAQAGANAPNVSILFSSAATPAEMTAARRHLRQIQHETRTRFGSVLRGQLAPDQLDALAQSPAVLWIEPTPRNQLFDESAAKIVAGDGGLHATRTQANGFDGAGVVVAVADSGLYTGETNVMHPDLSGRVDALFFYGTLASAADENGHGTHVAGIVAGNGATGEGDAAGLYGLGVAPGARLVIQRVFDGAGEFQAPPSYATLARDAVRAGADIGCNSWGQYSQGRYDLAAMEFDALVRDADDETPGDQPYILEFAAGNAGPGPQTIGSPAVAKNVIATGASQSARRDFLFFTDGPNAMAGFSSRGPCEDGRIKPDLVAPGTWIASLRSPVGDDNNAWESISANYEFQGGTSQSSPHVAGAAAVLVQLLREVYGFPNPSPALVKAALINTAIDLDDTLGTAPAPNMVEGWGRVDVREFVQTNRVFEFLNQAHLLQTGQAHERRVVVVDTNQPLRITLVYTDVPGFPGAIPALVNDLDLEVLAPDGRIYRGNQFGQGVSIPDAPAADSINNVEGVSLKRPAPGEYLVRVIARHVAQDARRDTAAIDQDFALVVSGNLPVPGLGAVVLDRQAYCAPGEIKITLIDLDRGAAPSAQVTLQSATEFDGMTVTLRPNGHAGTFTGSVATATGPATPGDGLLQIAHDDLIQVEYYDAAYASLRRATARADLVPPVISNVAVTNYFGQLIVTWTTDEPADSGVRFGTNLVFTQTRTNGGLVTEHRMVLTDLTTGPVYQFAVASADAAGNRTTNDNGGQWFTFVVAPPALVLLVDDYSSDLLTPDIPVSTYTNALSEAGAGYAVWDVNALGGTPALADLRPYPVVIWRVNDSHRTNDTLGIPQQMAIRQYLDAGGAFFMASMQILSRVGPGPFRSNVLHVGQFTPNPTPAQRCAACDEDAGVPEVGGLANDSRTAGVSLALDYTIYPSKLMFGRDLSDTLAPTSDASAFLHRSDGGKPCAIKFPRPGQDSAGRVVFCAFPLDTIPESGSWPNNRASFLRNVLQFLVPGLDGAGSVALAQEAYGIASIVVVEVADSDLAGEGEATVTFRSSTAPDPVALALQETTRPGVFRGSVTLVDAANPPAAGQLRAQHGDAIYVDYEDASGPVTIQAIASVDTQPPVISQRTVTPQATEATLRWDTSEPADAVVQFGETPSLGRTVSNIAFALDHELRLPGLTPARVYYYQITSRDRAGNATVEGGPGQPLTFRTVQVLAPPFLDNLEQGVTNWSVSISNDSPVVWTLGMPNNEPGIEAHSPENAWGSNREGVPTDRIDTSLISPAIQLTGGNLATLRFWHRYTFSPLEPGEIDHGQLLLITNFAGPPIMLTQYDDASGDWVEATVNLTPYLGHTINIVWRHEVIGNSVAPRPGWLVDDVAILVTNELRGAVVVTNNLAQAPFSLAGPINRTGQGLVTVFSNTPAGFYSAAFLPVPYYLTPEPQSGARAGANNLFFGGEYTFSDFNHNDMSDDWELAYFGVIDSERTRTTDTDLDGFTDHAEFLAGTDPTEPDSKLQLSAPIPLPNGMLRLQWPSVPGRAYRVEGCGGPMGWTPLSGWITATNAMTSFVRPAPAVGPTPPFLYRLEVRP